MLILFNVNFCSCFYFLHLICYKTYLREKNLNLPLMLIIFNLSSYKFRVTTTINKHENLLIYLKRKKRKKGFIYLVCSISFHLLSCYLNHTLIVNYLFIFSFRFLRVVDNFPLLILFICFLLNSVDFLLLLIPKRRNI